MIRIRTAATTAIVSAAAIGAYTIYDRIPEVDPTPTNAPIANMQILQGHSTAFDAPVVNPAGITWMANSGTYLISTDNRVVAEVSADYSTVLSEMKVSTNPIGTGDTEGVAYLGNGQAAVVGERGVVVLLARTVDGWAETDRFDIEDIVAGTQLGSAAYDAATNTLYTAQKTRELRLYAIDLDDLSVEIIDMTLAPNLDVVEGRAWSEFTIAGMDFDNGALLANSEAFSSVLEIQTTGLVSDVYGIDNINEASGLTIRDGQIVLMGDAESYLPEPPIYLANLPRQARPAVPSLMAPPALIN